ncbi:hypothetical protein Gotur_024709 [Gossypium turneri]
MTPEAVEIMDKLKDKKAEYEAIASSDSSVHIDDIDNRIITFWVLKETRWLRCKRQQLSKLHNLNRRQHREKLRFNESMKNSSSSLEQMRQQEKQRLQRGKQSSVKSLMNSSSSFRV